MSLQVLVTVGFLWYFCFCWKKRWEIKITSSECKPSWRWHASYIKAPKLRNTQAISKRQDRQLRKSSLFCYSCRWNCEGNEWLSDNVSEALLKVSAFAIAVWMFKHFFQEKHAGFAVNAYHAEMLLSSLGFRKRIYTGWFCKYKVTEWGKRKKLKMPLSELANSNVCC